MAVSAENSASFMGTLVQRQYEPGQKYVQLVFETAEGMRLSLSRNVRMVRSLVIGQTYKVRGTERALGQKKYLHEPVAVPVSVKTSFSKRHKLAIILPIVIVLGLASASALAYAAFGVPHAKPVVQQKVEAKKTQVPDSPNTGATPAATATPVQSAAPPTSTPKNTPSTAPKTTTPVTSPAITPTAPVTDTQTTPTSATPAPVDTIPTTPTTTDPPVDTTPPAATPPVTDPPVDPTPATP
jgi:hypothetical protein